MENRRRIRNFRAAVFVALSITAWGASAASASTTIDARGTYVGTAQADSGTYSSSTVIDQENCAAGTFSGGGVGYSTFSGTINGSTITTHEKYLSGSYTSDSIDTFSTDSKGRLVASGTFTDSNGHHGSNSGTRISQPKGDICGETVSVSLTPATVNACGNTCAPDSAVKATVSVAGADGTKLSGEDVALRADDPGVAVSPVTDAGAGTYTATLHPSHTPGNVIVTATDNSATPAASGSATLAQECNPDAGAAVDDWHAWGGPVAHVAASRHCTSTTMRCLSTEQPSPAVCVITVTDKSPKPTPPTGEVRTRVTNRSDGTVYMGSNLNPGVSPPCTLTPAAASNRSTECIVQFQPIRYTVVGHTVVPLTSSLLTRKTQFSIHAIYTADPRHLASVGDASFTLSPEAPPLPFSTKAGKEILKNSGDYLGAAAKTLAVPFVASKIPGVTGVPKFLAKGAGLAYSLAALAGLELASAGLKAYADRIDPFDRRYKVVATPKPRRVPTALIKGAADRRTVSSFLNTIEQQLAVMTVLGTTENRASSAKKLGDKHAYRLQERAIASYLVRLAHLVDAQRSSQIAIQQSLNRMFAAAHVGPVLRLRIPAAEYRAAVESGQVGHELTRQLTQIGEGSASVLSFISSVVNTPIPARINVSTVLASSAMIKALRQEAALLRAEARRVPLR